MKKRRPRRSDAKRLYQREIVNQHIFAMPDNFYQKKIEAGKKRAFVHGENWETVNINDIVNRYTPDSIVSVSPGKLHFKDKYNKYEIVADIAGGYLRIMDLKSSKGGKNDVYLDINGNDGRFSINSDGKKHQKSNSDYMKDTHFKIMSWKEMQIGN